MALTPGTRFGPYTITAQIGAGGMGEVYRATDTKLGREVAIKTLPSALAKDTDRLARFEREAKLLAALNHAHIAAVYGLDEHEGTRFLAMELVEGETLEHSLLTGPLRVEAALRIALQIAEALEAAHAKGVVHRDLKPANVMLNHEGQVKVLDFGLAKAFSGNPSEASPAHSPALSLAMTEAGLILGTAGYMSPEQASGQATDQRTDVWAFGVVLYEMLTGRPLFSGETVPHILADVLRSEPDWSRLPSHLHPRIRQLLERCLDKRVRNRYHSIADARVDVEQALSDPRGTTQALAATAALPWGRRALPVGAALLLGAALAGAAAWSSRPAPPVAAATQRLSVVMPPDQPIVMPGFPTLSVALSPDGQQLVFVSLDREALDDSSRLPFQLALRSLDALTIRNLPGTAGGVQPFFSANGGWVGFFTLTGELKKVSLAGGAPITLVENINGANWSFGVWSEDDTIVFGTTNSGLKRVAAGGGEVTDLTVLDADRGELTHTRPVLVPGHEAVLFVTNLSDGAQRIEAVMLESGERRVVVDDARAPLALESGHLLFQRDEAVLVAPLDSTTLTLTGPAVPLLDAVQHDAPNIFSVAQLAASRNGTLAYIPAVAAADTLGVVGRDGAFEALAIPPGDYQLPRVSRDGRALAFIETRGQQRDVWVYDFERGTRTKSGSGGRAIGLAWHPSGRSLAIAHGTETDGYVISLAGLDGTERVLVRTPFGARVVRNPAWSPDGQHLAYTVQTGSEHDVWLYAVDDATSAPLLAGPGSEYSPQFSPDGRWLAFTSDESRQGQVYVQALSGGERVQVSIDGGSGAVWRPDGTELFFNGGSGPSSVVAVRVTSDGTALRFGRPAELFATAERGPADLNILYEFSTNVGTGFDLLPDGEGFVMVRLAASARREIVLVQNWFAELQRLAPAAR